MTTFREGDVVTRAETRGEEGRVFDVEEGPIPTVYVRWTNGAQLDYTSKWLTLLRRPLRVGDKLVNGKIWTTISEHGTTMCWGDGWTHEDGTPIDGEAPASCGHQNRTTAGCDVCKGERMAKAPAVEAKLDPRCATCLKPTHAGKCVSPIVVATGFIRVDPPLGGNNSHGVGGAEREAEVQNAYNQRNNERAAAMMGAGAQAEIQSIQRAIQDAHQGIKVPPEYAGTGPAQVIAYEPEKEETRAQRMLHHYERAVALCNEANQRANRLSDECGALASANRELLVENAQLRRDVERLTRKARR